MLRLGGRLPAFLTFLGDALKGVAAMFIGGGAMVAAFGVMLGHVFPFQLRFCGGKGVATYLGVLFYIAPLTATILMIFWVLFTLAFKKGALSSLILAALAPVLFFLVVGFKKHNLIIVCALSLFVLLTHIPNIIRLWRGTEKQADL
jgi:glycerol-3-phosphate acyltransferase PlsY